MARTTFSTSNNISSTTAPTAHTHTHTDLYRKDCYQYWGEKRTKDFSNLWNDICNKYAQKQWFDKIQNYFHTFLFLNNNKKLLINDKIVKN